jgi:acetyl-CoA C-acetyltransferase/acetyl-CoA acyltransferase
LNSGDVPYTAVTILLKMGWIMTDAFICDAIRTPIGRFGGALAKVRPDDLAAHVIRTLIVRNPRVDWSQIDDVIMGCANQAGEDNRNVARMAALLAGLPEKVGGSTVNRLCGSGLDAVGTAARAIRSGDAGLMIAGGVESMSRAPFVMPKAESAYSRNAEIHDTTIGWRFINPAMRAAYGVDSMPETAENVADDFGISREDQDAFALRSQDKAAAAQESGRFAAEITPVSIPQRKGDPLLVERDEHPRRTTLEVLAALKPVVRPDGTVTAGNTSGVNDGAAALIIASQEAAKQYGLIPRARIVGMASAGVAPRVMGIGPAPATRKLLERHGLTIVDLATIELNEAFAAQGLAVLRQLGIADDDPRVNPNGGAIALGHPLGMSGARLAMTATEELTRNGGRYALATMCVGVGQGISLLLERV